MKVLPKVPQWPWQDEWLNLTVHVKCFPEDIVDGGAGELAGLKHRFKIMKTTSLHLLMDAFCSIHDLQSSDVRFQLDGEEIPRYSTPVDNLLWDDDFLEAIMF